MQALTRERLLALAAAIIAIVGGFTLCATVDDDGAVTVTVNRPVPAGVQVDQDNNLDPAEKAEAGARPFSEAPEAPNIANAGPDIHEDARDETPPGVPLEDAADAQESPRNLTQALPPAGAQNYSCPSNPVVNQSPLPFGYRRAGVALHFTVSAPGSISAIRNLFNTPSFGASSNFGIELDGECQLWVPIGRKAWAQLTFNSAYISIEIVTNDLSRAQWLAAPILSKGILASLVADLLRQVGAPPRLVDPVGCTALAGVTDHSRLECGNTHWDVGKNFPWDVFMRQVRLAHGGADPVCDKACRARKRQRAVVAGRDRKHRETHGALDRHGCRRRTHSSPVSAYTRVECRRLKARDVRQRRGELRARRKLAAL